MPALSALELQILSQLEEGGTKDVAAVMNAMGCASGSAGELADMQSALENLVRADLVAMSMTRHAAGRLIHLSKAESLEVVEDLWSGLRFKAGRWIDTRHAASGLEEPFPFIVRLNR
jgi:hypothetical protein